MLFIYEEFIEHCLSVLLLLAQITPYEHYWCDLRLFATKSDRV